ncbi:hypothetical protein LJ737_13405 [Hymenobacter sp. 15J16-1T3B]|uniref:hypothetical protein n=1 Tax=Hymenobacter sp. 15J16-1T3B TaxID=2886941 RepID=UPI001D1058A0|nr:hypothetical protein [Hymenobacter sp. 15J16-1T3B]MCC3158239.1 hypothetical protein [Hymenobacter sp. 15J16-1T3B]
MKNIKRNFAQGNRSLLSYVALVGCALTSCSPIGNQKKFDWHNVWASNREKLILLTEDIKVNGGKKYKLGNNEFVDGFPYPFNEGFVVKGGREIDSAKILVKYYLDRGVMDHYSAFVYTNDSSEVRNLNKKVEAGANDYKLESNWYIIND